MLTTLPWVFRARPRGFFLFGHRPWLLVVVLVVVVAIVIYQQRRR